MSRDAMRLLRCPSNGCAMDCRCPHCTTPTLLETHVHKTAFWTVRNYDDHCTVVVAICGQSQNVPKMVLIIAWACDWFFHCRMPLIAWVRLPPRARPDCREGSRHCLHIFGLGCLMQLFGTRRNQARNQANSMENCM